MRVQPNSLVLCYDFNIKETVLSETLVDSLSQKMYENKTWAWALIQTAGFFSAIFYIGETILQRDQTGGI